jgi:DNA mismatch endonuclease (patch repair protein)
MSDIYTKTKRSEVMSLIRGKGNAATELRLIRLFRSNDIIGWRRHILLRIQTDTIEIKVRPDFIFRQKKLAVFVDGEFWHGHPTRSKIPKGNHKFWTDKIAGNKMRDRLVNRVLRKQGWTVIRIWQRDIPKQLTLRRLYNVLN